jgi:Protein of unknown function (DUF664)
MTGQHALAKATLQEACRAFVDNVRGISLDEALFAAGGYRSILGLMKHVAGWSAVYHSYAFDAEPRHWNETDWPRGLRDLIDPTAEYVQEVVAWFERSFERWIASVDAIGDLDANHPVHWGGALPLREIIVIVAAHWHYHAGEINALLAVRRGEAWEYGEEVEENHISTAGHGVRPDWMSDEEAAPFERLHARSRDGSG